MKDHLEIGDTVIAKDTSGKVAQVYEIGKQGILDEEGGRAMYAVNVSPQVRFYSAVMEDGGVVRLPVPRPKPHERDWQYFYQEQE